MEFSIPESSEFNVHVLLYYELPRVSRETVFSHTLLTHRLVILE